MTWTIWPWPYSTNIWSPIYVLDHNGNLILIGVMLLVHYLVGRALGRATHVPPVPLAVMVCLWELTFNGTLGVMKAWQGGKAEYLWYHAMYGLLALLCCLMLALALAQEQRRRTGPGRPARQSAGPGRRTGEAGTDDRLR